MQCIVVSDDSKLCYLLQMFLHLQLYPQISDKFSQNYKVHFYWNILKANFHILIERSDIPDNSSLWRSIVLNKCLRGQVLWYLLWSNWTILTINQQNSNLISSCTSILTAPRLTPLSRTVWASSIKSPILLSVEFIRRWCSNLFNKYFFFSYISNNC